MEEQPEEPLGGQGEGGISGDAKTEVEAAPGKEPGGKKGTSSTRIVVLSVVALLVLTLTIVRLVQNHDAANAGDFQPGDILHLIENDAPFGTVLEIDEAHKFNAGPPTQAFLVRLAASDSETWISRDFAGKGLYKASVESVEDPPETDVSAGEAAPETE